MAGMVDGPGAMAVMGLPGATGKGPCQDFTESCGLLCGQEGNSQDQGSGLVRWHCMLFLDIYGI